MGLWFVRFVAGVRIRVGNSELGIVVVLEMRLGQRLGFGGWLAGGGVGDWA